LVVHSSWFIVKIYLNANASISITKYPLSFLSPGGEDKGEGENQVTCNKSSSAYVSSKISPQTPLPSMLKTPKVANGDIKLPDRLPGLKSKVFSFFLRSGRCECPKMMTSGLKIDNSS
jgi:hypothetical protein